MKITVYTAIFGNIDRLWSVYPLAQGDAQHICYTDRPLREVGLWTDGKPPKIRDQSVAMGVPRTWDVRLVEPEWDSRRTARHYKALSHRVDADVTIWVDGNVRLLADPHRIVDQYLGNADLAIFKHPDRKCLYEEAQFCAQVGKDSGIVLQRQVGRYKAEGMPANWGLPETRCVIRRWTPEIAMLNELWWQEIENHSVRDQVSLPYACWKLGIRWREIPGRCWPRNTHEHFYYVKHKQ